MNQQQLTGDAIRRPRYITPGRFALVLLAVLALAIFISWRSLLPDSSKSVPGTLTERDQNEIAQLCRRHTVRFGIEKLRRAEFGWFVRSARVLFQQKIDRLIDDRDGNFRAYVVVYDQKEPEGFYAWYRHQLTKTNGHWTILRSY
jgi:hypothetical protein